MTCGILLLDKPVGISSNAAVQRVRRRYGSVKGGHAGSLDPLASGMLPICLGEATKIAGALLSERKAYGFEVTLGERRSTGDAEGEVIERAPVPAPIDGEGLRQVVQALLGAQLQVPPMYSALKLGGVPLYRLARRGQTVERAARSVYIHDLDCWPAGPGRLGCRVVCSKGTYVRVLAEQIASQLGSCGYVSALRRLYVQPFEAQPMLELARLESGAELPPLLPADLAVAHLPDFHAGPDGEAALRQGRRLAGSAGRFGRAPGEPGQELRLYGAGEQFMGLGRLLPGGQVAPRRLLAPAAEASAGARS